VVYPKAVVTVTVTLFLWIHSKVTIFCRNILTSNYDIQCCISIFSLYCDSVVTQLTMLKENKCQFSSENVILILFEDSVYLDMYVCRYALIEPFIDFFPQFTTVFIFVVILLDHFTYEYLIVIEIMSFLFTPVFYLPSLVLTRNLCCLEKASNKYRCTYLSYSSDLQISSIDLSFV
jgi:hypothetical protein